MASIENSYGLRFRHMDGREVVFTITPAAVDALLSARDKRFTEDVYMMLVRYDDETEYTGDIEPEEGTDSWFKNWLKDAVIATRDYCAVGEDLDDEDGDPTPP